MIEQIMMLEQMKRLLKMAKAVRASKECGWQEKYLIFEGEIMKVEEHLEQEFSQIEAEFEKQQGRLLH